jgi:multiple sugar transport system ATP-binding protein
LLPPAAGIVALTDLLDRKPKQLSGGQRQRVALARALVRRPRLFLLDEPLSNLDVALRADTRGEIVDLQKRLGATTVYVTHDQGEAMTMASRIAVMMDGSIAQLGTPQEIYRHPADTRVARFIGAPAMTLLDGSIVRGSLRLTGGDAPLSTVAGAADGPVIIGIRAEHLRVTAEAATAPIAATVHHVEFLGAEVIVHLVADRLPGAPAMVARLDPHAGELLSAGARVGVRPDPSALHLFDPDGRRIDTAVPGAHDFSVAS